MAYYVPKRNGNKALVGIGLLVFAIMAALALPFLKDWHFGPAGTDLLSGLIPPAAAATSARQQGQGIRFPTIGAKKPGVYAGNVRMEPVEVEKPVYKGDHYDLLYTVTTVGARPYATKNGELEIVFKTESLANAYDPAGATGGYILGGSAMLYFAVTPGEANLAQYDYVQALARSGTPAPARKVDTKGKSVIVDFPGATGTVVVVDNSLPTEPVYYLVQID